MVIHPKQDVQTSVGRSQQLKSSSSGPTPHPCRIMPRKKKQGTGGGTGGALGEVLDDLCARFLLNIPEAERGDKIRVCFQGEHYV